MKRFAMSLILNSCLVNALGLLFVTGLHVWNMALVAILPIPFYFIAFAIANKPHLRTFVHRSAKISFRLAISLLLGHILELGLALICTAYLGKPLSFMLNGGVEMMEMFFTNSSNSVTLGIFPAFLIAWAGIHFVYMRPLEEAAAS